MEGIALEIAVDLSWKAILKGGVFLYKGLRGSDCKRLQQIANKLLPIVKEICGSNSESSSKLSLQKFEEFRNNLVEVNELAADHKTTNNPKSRIKINERVKKLEKSINEFIQNDLPIVMASAQDHLSTQLGAVRSLQENMRDAHVDLSIQLSEGMENLRGSVEKTVVTIREAVETGEQTREAVETVLEVLLNFISRFDEQQKERSQQNDNLCKLPDFCGAPDTPSVFLGFDEPIIKLKIFLLEEGVNVVGVTAMGGAGKSTLAAAVCNHHEIKDYFKEKVKYIEVSESPNLLTILKTMWEKILAVRAPDFKNVKDARKELQWQIKSINQPILVVLDGLGPTVDLEQLLFEEKQYKTLVTTRHSEVITNGPNRRNYDLPFLQPEHARALLCHYAFGKTSITIDEKLVEKVQKKCNGLPLALKVIGSSLYGKSKHDWERSEKRLIEGGDQSQSLFNTLKTSIDVLNDHERECFLDLGAFPQRKVIPAKALLDIWVYVRKLNLGQAKMRLRKFADRHLLELKKNTGTSEDADDSMDIYSVSQHAIMRDLALKLAKEANGRRLYMPRMKNELPSEWKNLSYIANIVSIHTGAMENSDWPETEFPQAEVLVLYFTAIEYCLPTFLNTMKNLKVLIIYNCDGPKRSKLSGTSGFQGLSQLKTLYLEKLIVPKECNVLKSLEKIYMSLCEGLDRDLQFNFSELLEFNVSYCIDLEELPAGLCCSSRLEKLSVTHCHGLAKLPDEMGRFESLKKLRLCESAILKTLPSSIRSLKKLKLLDISSCEKLKAMKKGAGFELKVILQALARLESLKLLICDEQNEWVFEKFSRTELKVHAVQEEFNLKWLDL